jgi:hypothetical protein
MLRKTLSGAKLGIQYASNLYANSGWQQAWSALLPGAAPTLALLGNCGSVATEEARSNTFQFLRRAAATYERVFYVPGPLEMTAAEGDPCGFTEQWDALDDLAFLAARKSQNIVILQQNEWYDSVKDVVVLGATGWTPCAGMDTVPEGVLERGVWTVDTEMRQVTPDDLRTWHIDDIRWLRERVSWWSTHRPVVKIIILTHHLCSGQLVSMELPREAYRRMALDVMPVDVLPKVVAEGPVAAWLCGAMGSCVSGLSRGGPQRPKTFLSSNSLYSLGAQKGRVEQFMPDRRLELR